MAYIPINVNAGDTSLVTLTLTAGPENFLFVVDTGSNVSHISKESVTRFPNADKVKETEQETTGLEGTTYSVGEVSQCLSSGMFTFSHTYLITDLSKIAKVLEDSGGFRVDGILGTDFLQKFRCHLDFKKNRLHMG